MRLKQTLAPELIDTERLATWMDQCELGSGAIGNITRLGGGTQNLVLSFERGGRVFVLRRPPWQPRAGSDELMRREARILHALGGTDVPCPTLIAACGDVDVVGYAFYLMDPIDGFNPVTGLPALHASSPQLRREMGFAAIDAMASLHRIDPDEAGLAGFGRPEGFLERQVVRWGKQFESYHEVSGWQGADALPGIPIIGEWLDRHRPSKFTPGIMHGDYHLGNLMYRNDGSQVAAIVDWEMATVGDPLVDLGWLLSSWPEPDGSRAIAGIEPWEGFPTASELIARYEQSSDRNLSAIQWYEVFACYKFAIVLEGTHVRARAGKVRAELGRQLNQSARALVMHATKLIGT